MILNFAQKIDNKRMFFEEKIISGLIKWGIITESDYAKFRSESEYPNFLTADVCGFLPYKIHSIRGVGSRFKEGTPIHFKRWYGRPYHSKNINFGPIIPVKSKQNIKVLEFLMTDADFAFKMPDGTVYGIEVDGISQSKEAIRQIALNDGFDNEVDFFKYFRRFEGEIIHWTELAYYF